MDPNAPPNAEPSTEAPARSATSTDPTRTSSGYPRSWAAGPTNQPGAQPTYPAEVWSGVDKPPVDGFAITSLITGLLGGVLFSVGFGTAALVRISRGKRRGQGLAVAGLTLSLAWVIAIVAILSYYRGRQPDRDTSGTVTHQGQVAPADLHIGDCVLVPRVLSGTYTSLTIVPCRQSHNGQVFDIRRSQDAAYPGDASLRAEAVRDCRAAVPTFLGTNQTLLHVVAFFPPERSWNIGRRDEHCLLVGRAKNITGDIRSDK